MSRITFNLVSSGKGVVKKTDRQVRVKPGRVKSTVFVREQYLRSDIPCQSSLCTENCQNDDKNPMLTNDVTHYVVPCADVVGNYMEVLEVNELIGMLFMQTVVTKCLHEFGKRLYRRICLKIREKTNICIYFPNEFSFYTYSSRKSGESNENWQIRNIYAATVWYFRHLSGNVPIVMLTDKKNVIDEYQNKTSGIFVISLSQYLTDFWPNLTHLQDLYFSLHASLSDVSSSTSKNDDKDFVEYASDEILNAGLLNGQYREGKLRVNKHQPHSEAYITTRNSEDKNSADEILVFGMKNRNRAIHGDLVAVELLPRSEWKGKCQILSDEKTGNKAENEETTANEKSSEPILSGRVVGIIQRNWRNYVATLPVDDANAPQRRPGEALLVLPYDKRIPKIRIAIRQMELLENQRIIVRIDSWAVSSQYPNGHFVQALGPIGELNTETTVLLVENGINTSPFPAGVLNEMPTANWKPIEDEIAGRYDIRSTHLVFSIDPEGCEDVDDAMSIRCLPNGHCELGVHIADVTNFVPAESLTDLEAKNRATTIYLADRRFDMLPRVLNSNVCSLLSKVDRFSVSIFWELDSAFNLCGVKFQRTVLNSSYKLTYEVAEKIIYTENFEELKDTIKEFDDLDDEQIKNKYNELRNALIQLTLIAQHLKRQRMLNGALELESIEVKFIFKQMKEGQLEDIKPKEDLEIHETVAECMILANQWVAKTIYDSFPRQALLRHHPIPCQDHFKDLICCAESKNFHIDSTSNKTLAESLNRSVDLNDPNVNNLLRQLATHAMRSAEYFCTGSQSNSYTSHYGLGVEFYTHFTSPIRRYSDVLVHRLLLAFMNKDKEISHLMTTSELEEVCEHLNARHKAAQDIQKSSQLLFQTLFFLNKSEDDECLLVDAVIFSFRANGFLVYVARYGIKGPVFLRSKDKRVAIVVENGVEWVSGSLNNQKTSLQVISDSSISQEYKLFDHVTVKIRVVRSHAHAHEFKLDLVSKCPLVSDFKWGQEDKLHFIVDNKQATTTTSNRSGQLFPSTADINNSSSFDMPNNNLYNVFNKLRELSLVCPV